MNFLLEIGTEEIPHWMIPGALTQLAGLDLLGAASLVDATPRRLVVRAGGLPERTPDQEQIVKGPPVSAGERAAAGFAKKQGVDVSAMTVAGEYYELRKSVPGRRAIDILAETLPAAIVGIQWPKTMYWTGKNGPRFIRPIRWIVALLDDQVIPFEIAGVKSGNVTRGHRQLGASRIPVTIENYASELRKNFVILSSHERRHKIETEASALGAKIDPDLLETLTFITEYPAAIRGDFDPAFLELPAEVLTTVMRHHQKYFSVEPVPGRLAPNFVAVMNTSGDPEGLVQRGNERVLKARFNDARFFWNVDQQKKLEDRVQDLKKVTFQAKLGSYYEKTQRVVELVKELGGNEHAERAAQLSKTDLTTEMVKEFTELQGVVGGLYGRAQGEPELVWKAIYEHYQPVNMEDSIPETREGQIVSVADKLDTLIECFRVGMIPSGSKDPFALRRAAQGLIRVLIEGDLKLDLPKLRERIGESELWSFLRERLLFYFDTVRPFAYDERGAVFALLSPEDRDRQYSIEIPKRTSEQERQRLLRDTFKRRGFGDDEIEAVLAASVNDFEDIALRLKAVRDVRHGSDFEPIAISIKRIRRILNHASFKGSGKAILEHSFEAGPERELYKEYARVVQGARRWLPTRSYSEFLELVASTRPAVDRFFERVMVMDSDPSVSERRLELLYRIDLQFNAIADFSEIVTSGDQK